MSLRAPNILVAALLAMCLHLVLAAPAGAASVYWGANIGPHLNGASPPYDMDAADIFEGMARKRMSLIEYSLPWADCNSTPCTFHRFPRTQMESIRRRGSIPVFGWASYSQPLQPDQPEFQLSKITGGAYDPYLREWAAAAREWGKAFFMVFDWEMNLDGVWPYEEGASGNRAGDFVKMWRHVHDIFRQEGANNVTWTWCPNVEFPGSADLRSLYPGDAYVDWTCIDGYNWSWGWRWFADVFGSTYDVVQAIAPSKPILIGETASTEKNGSKAAWITDMLSVQLPRRFPNVKGVVWFEKEDIYSGENWVIGTSPSSQEAFAAGIASPYYAGATFGDVASPIPPLSPIVTKNETDPVDAPTSPGERTSASSCRLVLGKMTCSTRCVVRKSKTTGKRVLVCPKTKRCVARRSKKTGKRVLVCRKLPLIRALRTDTRIRAGFSLPSAIRAANAPIRFTLNRDARVTLRFALRDRRTGRYSPVSGSIRLRLKKGRRGVLLAGRLSEKTTLEPGRYRVSVTATDVKRRKSRTVRSTFTLLERR